MRGIFVAPRFILTPELGRLAKWLRILGFDSEYFRGDNTSSLIIQALREDRIILSRNHRLPSPRGMRVFLIKQERIKEQLKEVFGVLGIKPEVDKMFSRCIICNIGLEKIAKEQIKEKVPGYVFNTQEEFIFCPRCQRVYWPGTHWGNVKNTLEELNG